MSVGSGEYNRRPCLRCKQYFDSEWNGNRVCPKCRKSNAKLATGLQSYDMDNSGYSVPTEDHVDGTSSRSPNNSSQALLS